MQSFSELKLDNVTLTALNRIGFTTPTAIQAQAIPSLLEGRDVLAQARTGTGKTAAFGVPMVEGAAYDREEGIVGLVLVPTRELAVQVTDDLERFAHGTDVKTVPIYGGVGMHNQIKAVKRRAPLIVVATPGRLLDHIRQRTIDLGIVRMLVLDEADRMLDMGFLPDVRRILEQLPAERQTALFSATLPQEILRISNKFMRDPQTFRVESGPATVTQVEQFGVFVQATHKKSALMELIATEQPGRAVVFTRTKHRARGLARDLKRAGTSAVPLEGNMSQSQRERALHQFRTGHAKILVATDVASRGLDIANVTHVINFDLPAESDSYVHRVGRTARMGTQGKAYTFVQPDQERDWKRVQSQTGATATELDFAGNGADVQATDLPPWNDDGPRRDRYRGNGGGGRGQRGQKRGRSYRGSGGPARGHRQVSA